MQKLKTNKTCENKELNIMFNFDKVIGENTRKDNPQWPHVPDHRYRILTVGRSRPGKIDAT